MKTFRLGLRLQPYGFNSTTYITVTENELQEALAMGEHCKRPTLKKEWKISKGYDNNLGVMSIDEMPENLRHFEYDMGASFNHHISQYLRSVLTQEKPIKYAE